MRMLDHVCLRFLWLLGAGLWLGLAGCFSPFEVECGADAHCGRSSGGLCHANPATDRRWCSYPDLACPSGYRYSDLDVGDGVSAGCTGEPPARCDPNAEFGEPMLMPNVNSSLDEVDMTMTRDELFAMFYRLEGSSRKLLTSTRTSVEDEFPPPTFDTRLTPVTSAVRVFAPQLTGDGLVLYFLGSDSSGMEEHIRVATRNTREDSFGEPSAVFFESYALKGIRPIASADGQTLYWIDWFDFKLRAATRARVASFQRSIVVSEANRWTFVVSADELTLYYADGFRTDVFIATRESLAAPFERDVLLSNVNSAQEEAPIFISADECVLYMSSNRLGGLGGSDIWLARRSR